MSALDDWAVTLILLAICVVVILIIVFTCKLFASWKFAAFFGTFDDAEKAQLTKQSQRNGYTFTPQVPVGTEDTGSNTPYQQYDAPPGNEQGYVNQAMDVTQDEPKPWPKEEDSKESPSVNAPEQETNDTSPVSVDSMSVASDYDPPGGLQRAASCESISSDSSVMQLEPEAPKIGQLEFGLEYDREVSELIISVIQARDLEVDKVSNTVDSYVRCWVYPAKDHKKQTKIVKDSPNPVFKERFLFTIEQHDILSRIVRFQVCSCDKYARHKLLGETELRMSDIDLRHPIRVWMNLRDMDEKLAEYGDIMFSLSYLPTAERLTLVIVKARHLRWSNGKESGDCFVKVNLLQNGKRVGKKKTTTKKDEKNPIFNEAMIFSVPSASLNNIQLRVSIVEHGEKCHSIGHVIVGSNLSGTQGTHWNQMMSCLRKPVAMWHSLRK